MALPRKIPNGQFAFCLRAPLTLPKKRSRKPRLAAAVRASRDLSAPLATLTLTRGTMALLSALLALHPPLCPPCQQSDQPRRTSVNDKSSTDTGSISCKLQIRFTVLQMMSVQSNFKGQQIYLDFFNDPSYLVPIFLRYMFPLIELLLDQILRLKALEFMTACL